MNDITVEVNKKRKELETRVSLFVKLCEHGSAPSPGESEKLIIDLCENFSGNKRIALIAAVLSGLKTLAWATAEQQTYYDVLEAVKKAKP